MKKILTLLIAMGGFAAVHAQTSKEEARKIILGQEKNKGGTPSDRSRDIILGGGDNDNDDRRTYPSSRNSTVDQINREYDAKINSIRNNRNLNQEEKERIIRQLENDRKQKIRQVSNNGKEKKYHKNRKYKSNNGKHKGWSKGKGNKHRDRDDD